MKTQIVECQLTISKWVVVLDGISEPACGMRNWDGAISHASQLVQHRACSGMASAGDAACQDPATNGYSEPILAPEVIWLFLLLLPHALL